MKKGLLLIAFMAFFTGFGQQLRQPATGKALVYFSRVSSTGFLINFKYFDSEKYLGKFAHGHYMVYECEPGKHVFWAKSENFSFVEADLEAGKVYIIDSEPQMGAIKAGVKLLPFDTNPAHYKNEKKFIRKKTSIFDSLVEQTEYKTTEKDIQEEQKDLNGLVARGMEKYNKQKQKGEAFEQLTPEMNYN